MKRWKSTDKVKPGYLTLIDCNPVISHTSKRFRKLLAELPKHIKQRAREVYKQFEQDPYHPGLHFKRVHSTKPIYSVRINIEYRALGILSENEIIWFWIGPHKEYDRLLSQL
jgi:Txe/YoeB family toxin of Txe-Axe toxin-antitoxin module